MNVLIKYFRFAAAKILLKAKIEYLNNGKVVNCDIRLSIHTFDLNIHNNGLAIQNMLRSSVEYRTSTLQSIMCCA